ncbi:hypothetical protein [Halorussus sp. AFM4]|uniref:hypothetical protein n=1 Tax=Halorussus sp. AFM4 TaxID=3421651 RepID=UPI003EBBD6B1
MPAENGYVPTPAPVADYAAAAAFGTSRPGEIDDGRMLFPGLGTGNLYDAVRRYCTEGENWYVPNSTTSSRTASESRTTRHESKSLTTSTLTRRSTS